MKKNSEDSNQKKGNLIRNFRLSQTERGGNTCYVHNIVSKGDK